MIINGLIGRREWKAPLLNLIKWVPFVVVPSGNTNKGVSISPLIKASCLIFIVSNLEIKMLN